MSQRKLKWLVLFTLLLSVSALLTLARHTGEAPATNIASSTD